MTPSDYLKTQPEEFRLHRDGERDLTFLGWKLGEGSSAGGGRRIVEYEDDDLEAYPPIPSIDEDEEEYEYERGTTVTIYISAGGTYVVHVSSWSDFGDHWRYSATLAKTHEELLEALRHKNKIGAPSRDAFNEATELYEPLREIATERIA